MRGGIRVGECGKTFVLKKLSRDVQDPDHVLADHREVTAVNARSLNHSWGSQRPVSELEGRLFRARPIAHTFGP